VPATIRTSDELRRYALTNVTEPIAEHDFRRRFSDLLDGAPDGLLRGYAFVTLPAAASAWLDTGIDLAAGGAVTLFATARRPSAAEAEGPSRDDRQLFHRLASEAAEALRGVWYRVGADGRASRGTRSSHTFLADCDGRLFLAAAPVSDPATTSDLQPERRLFDVPRVDRFALVVHWAGDPLEGVRTLRAGGEVGGLLDCEIARQRAAIELPDGWHYAPPGVEGEQFAADGRRSGEPIIGCYSRSGAALLRKHARLPFLPGTTLRWAWLTHQLGSRVREDRLSSHNYISLAVEFDNGRDLTYYWSSELPVDSAYTCPVPDWEDRETHVVVRCGEDGLGQWLDEERDLYADYSRYVGAPPSGIVSVWILASTYRGRTDAWCDYGRVELANSSLTVRVN